MHPTVRPLLPLTVRLMCRATCRMVWYGACVAAISVVDGCCRVVVVVCCNIATALAALVSVALAARVAVVVVRREYYCELCEPTAPVHVGRELAMQRKEREWKSKLRGGGSSGGSSRRKRRREGGKW